MANRRRISVDSVLGLLHLEDVGVVADDSEVHAASIFRF
jgi:septum formation inhibitor-activating ATPase MinD